MAFRCIGVAFGYIALFIASWCSVDIYLLVINNTCHILLFSGCCLNTTPTATIRRPAGSYLSGMQRKVFVALLYGFGIAPSWPFWEIIIWISDGALFLRSFCWECGPLRLTFSIWWCLCLVQCVIFCPGWLLSLYLFVYMIWAMKVMPRPSRIRCSLRFFSVLGLPFAYQPLFKRENYRDRVWEGDLRDERNCKKGWRTWTHHPLTKQLWLITFSDTLDLWYISYKTHRQPTW